MHLPCCNDAFIHNDLILFQPEEPCLFVGHCVLAVTLTQVYFVHKADLGIERASSLEITRHRGGVELRHCLLAPTRTRIAGGSQQVAVT